MSMTNHSEATSPFPLPAMDFSKSNLDSRTDFYYTAEKAKHLHKEVRMSLDMADNTALTAKYSTIKRSNHLLIGEVDLVGSKGFQSMPKSSRR